MAAERNALAVLDREIAYQEANGFLPGHLKDIRAAVAELIEAGEPISTAIENNVYDESSNNENVEIVLTVGELRRFRAALARVQGEGA